MISCREREERHAKPNFRRMILFVAISTSLALSSLESASAFSPLSSSFLMTAGAHAYASPYHQQQCPSFAPALAPSAYKDYQFSRNETSTTASAASFEGIYSPPAIECSLRGKSAIVTPLFGHRITTDDVSPLRKLSDHGYWSPLLTAASLAKMGTGSGVLLDGTEAEYAEALQSGLGRIASGSGVGDGVGRGEASSSPSTASSSSAGGGDGVSADAPGLLTTLIYNPSAFLATVNNDVLLPVKGYLLTIAGSADAVWATGAGIAEALLDLTRDGSRSGDSALTREEDEEKEYTLVFEDGSDAAKEAQFVSAKEATRKQISAFRRKLLHLLDQFVNHHTLRRWLNTFVLHIPRLFGRIVTRIEYRLENTANRQFIPTLKMFVVKPKRVLSGVQPNRQHHRHAHEEVAAPLSVGSESNEGVDDSDEKEYISAEETLAAAASSAFDDSIPLSCEVWENALNDRLLHVVDAPEKDVFPDAITRRRQIIAQFRRMKEEGLVEEVCRPFRSGWLPPWLQAKFSWTGTESSTRMMSLSVFDVCSNDGGHPHRGDDLNSIGGGGNSDRPRTGPDSEACKNALEDLTTQFQCEFSVPVASHSCLVVESLYRNKDVNIAISQSYVWDTAVIGFILTLIAVSILKPILVTNKWLQLVSAAGLGIFFVIVVLVWLIVKDLKKTRLGQLGIVAMITAGGIISFSETITSMLWYYLTVEVRTNGYLQAGLFVAAVGSALVSRYLFYERVPTITHYTLTVLQIVTWFALASHNREVAAMVGVLTVANALDLFAALKSPRRIVNNALTALKWAGFITFWPLITLFCILRWVGGVLRIVKPNKSAEDAMEAEPHETFPEAALRPRPYYQPLAAEGIYAPTAEAKFRMYEQQGSEHTRKALKELTASIRSNPSVLGRLQDPNGVARYFGVVADTETGDFIAEHDE